MKEIKRFTRHDHDMVKIMSDPVEWAKHHLGDTPRWYQEQILRHPHHRKVLRCGRRIGKTWTMTAHMMWVAFTCNGGKAVKKGATCIVATPYETQVREIFDQIKTFIDNNPVLADSVKSMTKNPFSIEFKNKSRIKLFTAGTRSGAEGGSLRGQKADWIYMDEVDYMTDKDFETIYAISLADSDNIGVMIASTPTGRRGMYHKICTEMKFSQDEILQPDDGNFYDRSKYSRRDAEGWKEFYFPTMVNPSWNPKMEKDLRKMYSQVAYEHEVLAEFGTEMVGVFNKDYIDESCSIAYDLTMKPQGRGPVVFGVDWDKFGAATQIVVTQYDEYEPRRSDSNAFPGLGRFKIIQRIEIPKGDFTYDNAVATLIDMDKVYNPEFIYADRGSGEYQIEMLRKHIGEKVKGVHLGSSHEVRDPVSRVYDKKPIKPFMVNQATLLLERGMLRIPHQDVDETLYRQMTNYQVVRISPKTGEPTFSNTDEHALDAFMLGLLAFIIEMPDIAATIEQIQVARKIGSASMKYVDPLNKDGWVYDEEDREYRMVNARKWDEPGNVPPRKVALGWKPDGGGYDDLGWGRRGSGNNSMPKRGGW